MRTRSGRSKRRKSRGPPSRGLGLRPRRCPHAYSSIAARRLAEQGEVDKGLLWIVEGLRAAPTPELQALARANWAAWEGRAGMLRAILEHKAIVIRIAFSPDGRTILTGSRDGSAALERRDGPADRAANQTMATRFKPWPFRQMARSS